MTDATFTEKLVLASTSPRRAEILRAVGWPFETLAPNVDETRALDEDAVAYVRRLAQAKAKAAAPRLEAGLEDDHELPASLPLSEKKRIAS